MIGEGASSLSESASTEQELDNQKITDLAQSAVFVANPKFVRMRDQNDNSQVGIARGPLRTNNTRLHRFEAWAQGSPEQKGWTRDSPREPPPFCAAPTQKARDMCPAPFRLRT